MTFLNHTKKRVKAFLDEAGQVAESEFPYRGSQMALEKLTQLFKSHQTTLDSFTGGSDPAVVKQACALALEHLFVYLPFLGFILRSTHVRNAFEVFRPLLRLASDVLEPTVTNRQTQLVLSSEWDYSPFVFSEVPELPGFVLIGIPSPESSNPLLVPLAGHELGHSVWLKDNSALLHKWEPLVRAEVIAVIASRWADFTTSFPHLTITPAQLLTNVTAMEAWYLSEQWPLLQAEESFCDFLGLRIFGWSYLEAFSYLLSPGVPGSRSTDYPTTLVRIDNLLKAAALYGVTPSAGYTDQFEDSGPLFLPDEHTFRLEIADAALLRVVDRLIAEADDVVAASGITKWDDARGEAIFERLKLVVPQEKCECVADILNAAWKAFRDPDFWNDNQQVFEKKDLILKELVLKNIELFEIEQILKGPP